MHEVTRCRAQREQVGRVELARTIDVVRHDVVDLELVASPARGAGRMRPEVGRADRRPPRRPRLAADEAGVRADADRAEE